MLQSFQNCTYRGTEREKPTRTWPARLFDSASTAHRFGGFASPIVISLHSRQGGLNNP